MLPSTGERVPTPWYDMHPQNITDALQVRSLSPNSPKHSGRRRSSGFLQTYILLLLPNIIFVSSLKMTRDQFSRTVHVNFCLQKRFRRSRFTCEIVIRFETTRLLYPSSHSLLLTVLSDILQPDMLLNLLVRSFNVCRLLPFTRLNKTRSSRGVVFFLPPLRRLFSVVPLSFTLFKNF